jgi:hypothetical protein
MAIVGGLLIGIGLGKLLGDMAAWILIGLGAGFIFQHIGDEIGPQNWPFFRQRPGTGA